MKKYLKWLVVCVLIFVISIFAHECGHGLANAMAGISCSTGFNRVGDIYKYPINDDFRKDYNATVPVLLDFGVPCTLALAIVGTILFKYSKKKSIRYLGAVIAIDNSLLRSIPCSMVLLNPILTGTTHVEDEYETGQLLVQLTGSDMWLYIPAMMSWFITTVCLVFTIRIAVKRRINHLALYLVMSVLAIFIGFAIAFVLDNYIRINWQPFC